MKIAAWNVEDMFLMCSHFEVAMSVELKVGQEQNDHSDTSSPLDQKAVELWDRMNRAQKQKTIRLLERLIRYQGAAKSP